MTLITPFTWPKMFALSSMTVKGAVLPLPTLIPLPGTNNSRDCESPDCCARTLAGGDNVVVVGIEILFERAGGAGPGAARSHRPRSGACGAARGGRMTVLAPEKKPILLAGRPAKDKPTICGAIGWAPDKCWLIAWRKLKPAPMPVKFGIGWYWAVATPAIAAMSGMIRESFLIAIYA